MNILLNHKKNNRLIKKVFSPIWDSVKHVWTRDIFRDVFGDKSFKLNRPEDYINHSLYFEAKTFLHGLLLVDDKLSMAHSLETRVPFLDNDLVDFAMKTPVKYKLGNIKNVIKMDENEPGKKGQKKPLRIFPPCTETATRCPGRRRPPSWSSRDQS